MKVKVRLKLTFDVDVDTLDGSKDISSVEFLPEIMFRKMMEGQDLYKSRMGVEKIHFKKKEIKLR